MSSGSKFYRSKGLVELVCWVNPELRERLNRAVRKRAFDQDRPVTQMEIMTEALENHLGALDD
jgi:hypothetical protein